MRKGSVKKSAEENALMKTLIFDEDNITIEADGKEIAKRNAKEYLTKEDFRYMDNEAYKFFIDLTKLHPRLKDYFDYNGINILYFVEEEFCFKSVFSHTIKDIVRAIGTTMKIIDVEQPYKIVVKDNASLKNRIALLTAEAMGLKTKVVSYGFSNSYCHCRRRFLKRDRFKNYSC